MINEISRRVRPGHQDIEVILEDAFGVRRALYVGLVSPGGAVNVEEKVTAYKVELATANQAMVTALNGTPDDAVVGHATNLDGTPALVEGQPVTYTFAQVKARL